MQDFKTLRAPEPLAVPTIEPLVLPTEEEGLLTPAIPKGRRPIR
jgi:hypothetical protein